MGRIIYSLLTKGGITGGHKMIVRHVEALRALGFDAVITQSVIHEQPTWFDYDAPFVRLEGLHADDVFVAPDDARQVLLNLAKAASRNVVFVQNPYYFASRGFAALDTHAADRFPALMVVGEGAARLAKRAYPAARTELVPCFADERIFRPAPRKRPVIAFSPRKRAVEAVVIQELFRKLHPRHADLEWMELRDATEVRVAEVMGEASLFLSLSRMESVGMTPLEAMLSGCVCAGFTGIGGREYATADNGFWVDEDDCEAAADALAAAADLVKAGGAPLESRLEAGFTAAEQWSYARFLTALEATWMRLAPELRVLNRP